MGMPLLKICPGFKINFETITIRERSSWEDVGRRATNECYFGERFLKSKSVKGVEVKIFAAPKPIEFAFIFDLEQWFRIRDFGDEEVCDPSLLTSYIYLANKSSHNPSIRCILRLEIMTQ